jgi:hypothetical protein
MRRNSEATVIWILHVLLDCAQPKIGSRTAAARFQALTKQKVQLKVKLKCVRTCMPLVVSTNRA